MSGFRLLPHISIAKVASEWDELAPIRLKQMLSGSDITFNHVMLPNLMCLLDDEGRRNALDAGCGVGVWTDYLANRSASVIGIDPSLESIRLATNLSDGNAVFANASIEQFATITKERFDVVTANMVLMDAPDLNTFVRSVHKLLRPGGAFVFSITHPFFWPRYYGYEAESWYSYLTDLIIESPFRISNEQDCRINSTHIHRPLSKYTDALTEAGLTLEVILEPMPDASISKMYPVPWEYPRYLIARCRKVKRVTTR